MSNSRFNLTPAMKSVLVAIMLAAAGALVTGLQAFTQYLSDPNVALSWGMFKDNFWLTFYGSLTGAIVLYLKSHVDLILQAFGDAVRELREVTFTEPANANQEKPAINQDFLASEETQPRLPSVK